MSKELSAALKKTMNAIEKRLEYLNNHLNVEDLEIVELEKSMVIQYLEDWNNFNNSFFFKYFNVDDSFFEKVTIFFVPKTKELSSSFQTKYSTLFCLAGEVLLIEDDLEVSCKALTTMDIEKHNFNIHAVKDSYLLLIK